MLSSNRRWIVFKFPVLQLFSSIGGVCSRKPMASDRSDGPLGSLSVGHDGERYFAESESWVLGIGAGAADEGNRIVFFDPPLAGMQLDPRTIDGEPVLFFNADQRTYEFRRSSAAAHTRSACRRQVDLSRRAADSND
jgi:hypothetical protein